MDQADSSRRFAATTVAFITADRLLAEHLCSAMLLLQQHHVIMLQSHRAMAEQLSLIII